MTVILAILIAILYFLGNYTAAFWVTCLAIAQNLYGLVRGYADPDWYFRKAQNSGMKPSLDFGPGLSLFVTKAAIIGGLIAMAFHINSLNSIG